MRSTLKRLALERLNDDVHAPAHATPGARALEKAIERMGLEVPIIVGPDRDGAWIIVDGHRRVSAARRLRTRLGQPKTVPAIVHDNLKTPTLRAAWAWLVNVPSHQWSRARRVLARRAWRHAGVDPAQWEHLTGARWALDDLETMLDRLAPPILNAWARQESERDAGATPRGPLLTDAHLEALCAASDHAQQRTIWDMGIRSGHLPSPERIRDALSKTSVRRGERLRRYVGSKRYLSAGGRTDTSTRAEIWIDREIAERIAHESLESIAEQIRTQERWGLAWVELPGEPKRRIERWDEEEDVARRNAWGVRIGIDAHGEIAIERGVRLAKRHRTRHRSTAPWSTQTCQWLRERRATVVAEALVHTPRLAAATLMQSLAALRTDQEPLLDLGSPAARAREADEAALRLQQRWERRMESIVGEPTQDWARIASASLRGWLCGESESFDRLARALDIDWPKAWREATAGFWKTLTAEEIETIARELLGHERTTTIAREPIAQQRKIMERLCAENADASLTPRQAWRCRTWTPEGFAEPGVGG